MPQMSGVELLKALRNDPDTAHIPVILLSAVPLKAKVAGASAFLAKPFEIEVLEKVVAKVAHDEAQANEAETPDRPPGGPRLSRPDSGGLELPTLSPASKIYWKTGHS